MFFLDSFYLHIIFFKDDCMKFSAGDSKALCSSRISWLEHVNEVKNLIIYKKEEDCLLCCVKTAMGQLYCSSPDDFVFENLEHFNSYYLFDVCLY